MKRTALLLLLLAALTGCSLAGGEPAKLETGMGFLEQQNYSEAEASFEAAVAAGENLQEAYRGMGMACMGMADYDKAVSYFELALKQSGGRVGKMEYDISYYLAVAEYKRGNLDAAIGAYGAILAMNPKDARACYLMGTLKLEKGLYDEAVQGFDAAVQNDEKNYDLYINIFESLNEYGYQEAGREYLTAAMALDAENISNYQKGKLSYYLQDYENARNLLETARSEEKDEESVTLYLGKTYAALGDLNYAVSLYSSYLDKHPEDVLLYNQMGLCQLGTGDYEGALRTFEAALAVEDNGMVQNLRYNEIVAYEYLSDFKKAAVLMEAYLKDYPDDTSASREYEFLKTR